MSKFCKSLIGYLQIYILICNNNYIDSKKIEEYRLYEIFAYNEEERKLLLQIQHKEINITFLNEVTNRAFIPIYVAVHPCCWMRLQAILTTRQIQYERTSWIGDK